VVSALRVDYGHSGLVLAPLRFRGEALGTSYAWDPAAAQRFGIAPDLHSRLVKYVGQSIEVVGDTLRVLHQGAGMDRPIDISSL